MTMGKQFYRYLSNCVGLNGNHINQMKDDSIDIQHNTFKKRIGKANYEMLSEQLGYTRGEQLSLATDYHVSFARSKYRGTPCYYCTHSSTEYVFVLTTN